MNSKSVKHDMENASTTLKRFTKAASPIIQNMVEYIRDQQAYHIVSARQLEILDRSMATIEQETDQLTTLAKQLIKDDNEVNYDQ